MTLRQLFALPGKSLPRRARATLESGHGMPELRERLAKESKAIKWDAVADMIADKAVELLDIPLLDILVAGWTKSREMERFADPEKFPPQATHLVALAEHTVKSEHHPYLEVSVREAVVGRIPFTLTVTLTLQALELEIQDGRIKAIRSGTLQGGGILALESAVVLEKDFGTLRLPGTLDFGEGIPLRRPEKPFASAAAAG